MRGTLSGQQRGHPIWPTGGTLSNQLVEIPIQPMWGEGYPIWPIGGIGEGGIPPADGNTPARSQTGDTSIWLMGVPQPGQ